MYFVISIFEGYLNSLIGGVTKYFIVIVCFYILNRNHFALKIRKFHISYIMWFCYMIFSLLWSQDYFTPRKHMFSIVGIVFFLIVLTSYRISTHFMSIFIKAYFFSSGMLGLLSFFFSKSYYGTIDSRQVLVMFDVEMDPNNLGALLLVGICIALHYLIVVRELQLLSILILIANSLACLKTGSRASLVTLVIISVFALFMEDRNKTSTSVLRRILLMVVLSGIGLVVVKYFIPDKTFERLFVFSEYAGGSYRSDMWQNIWELYTQNPFNIFFGLGWGTATIKTGYLSGVHNTFLSMLCDVGLIGFLVFFFPIFGACLQLMRKKSYLPILLILSAFIPSIFIDSINKRFFWNAIIILFIFYTNTYQIGIISKADNKT